jgi:hypothetical protein
MGQKSRRKRKNREPVENPTLFVFDGGIRHYEEGSMFGLRQQVTEEEWLQIVSDTLKYKIFIECLKDVACPILKESWTKEDDWWRLQLQVAVERIREVDPAALFPHNQDDIRKRYTEQMKNNAEAVAREIRLLRELERGPSTDYSKANVSAL